MGRAPSFGQRNGRSGKLDLSQHFIFLTKGVMFPKIYELTKLHNGKYMNAPFKYKDIAKTLPIPTIKALPVAELLGKDETPNCVCEKMPVSHRVF